MLTALDVTGETVIALTAARDDEHTCPACSTPVVLKRGRIKIAHIAHKADSECENAGESMRHLEMKMTAMSLFGHHGKWKFEWALGDHRSDFVVAAPKKRWLVVECQASPIRVAEFNRRTSFWNRNGFAVLWLWDAARFQPEEGNSGERRVPDEIRYCAGWYRRARGERVVFALQGPRLVEVHFDDVDRDYAWVDESGYDQYAARRLTSTKQVSIIPTTIACALGCGYPEWVAASKPTSIVHASSIGVTTKPSSPSRTS